MDALPDVGAVLSVAHSQGQGSASLAGTLANVASTYTGRLNETWQWFVRGDASYTDKVWLDSANLVYLDVYWVANAAVGATRDNLRVELNMRNLLEENAWLTDGTGLDFSQFGGSFSRRGIGLSPQEKRQRAVAGDGRLRAARPSG